MKLISFDQATLVTGYALFDEGNYIESGLIKKGSKIPIDERIPSMALSMCKKIKDNNVDLVVIEDVQSQGSISTVIQLARLQGCIILYCASKKIPIKVLRPSEWRKVLGFTQGARVKRQELKDQATNYIKDLGLNVKSTDECEAICIGIAAQK